MLGRDITQPEVWLCQTLVDTAVVYSLLPPSPLMTSAIIANYNSNTASKMHKPACKHC